jgi:cell volume regulation protein A
VQLDAAGLYPVLSGASAFVAYGAAASLGGSGFLAVYIAGMIVGNRRLPFQRGIRLFHDGLAWLAQIAMFVLLGLLSFPSRLLAVAGPAVLLALASMFVARPLAVWVCLAGFRFANREMAFIAWGGLKGAVPIVLATYPLLLGAEGTDTLFDVVFFVALVSAATQGWTLPAAARLLRLSLPPAPEPPVTLEITSLRSVDSDIIEYTLGPHSRAAGRRIRQLALPEGAVIAMVVRGHDVMPPRGSTALLSHDHVFVLVRPGLRRFLDRVFGEGEAGGASASVMDLTEFPLRGATRVSDLQEFYGVTLDASEELTLDELLRARVGDGLAEGATIQLGTIELRVREIVDGQVETVGLRIVVDEEIT